MNKSGKLSSVSKTIKSKSTKGNTHCKSLKTPVNIAKFKQEIVVRMLEMLLMIKLYHWKTHSFSEHKATDELYSSLNDHMDTFVEVLMGKDTKRVDLMKTRYIELVDLESREKLKDHIEVYKKYLTGLNHNRVLECSDSDLLNIRDEILADLNQFTYLLTLK